jgi:hypothetical protein
MPQIQRVLLSGFNPFLKSIENYRIPGQLGEQTTENRSKIRALLGHGNKQLRMDVEPKTLWIGQLP